MERWQIMRVGSIIHGRVWCRGILLASRAGHTLQRREGSCRGILPSTAVVSVECRRGVLRSTAVLSVVCRGGRPLAHDAFCRGVLPSIAVVSVVCRSGRPHAPSIRDCCRGALPSAAAMRVVNLGWFRPRGGHGCARRRARAKWLRLWIVKNSGCKIGAPHT